MPPGNVRTQPPVKVIERATVEACLAIVQRVQSTRRQVGDDAGAAAARQVAEFIRGELLGGREGRA